MEPGLWTFGGEIDDGSLKLMTCYDTQTRLDILNQLERFKYQQNFTFPVTRGSVTTAR